MKRLLFLLMAACFLFPYTSTTFAQNKIIEPTDKVIYLIDISGSMVGQGEKQTVNVFESVKAELTHAIQLLPQTTQVVIIPFGDNAKSSISLFATEKDSLCAFVQNLQASVRNTNILSAYNSALYEIDTTGTTSVFFITDGYHNGLVPTSKLYSALNAYPQTHTAKSCIMYYYITDSQYRDLPICMIFDTNESMELVESLCFTQTPIDTLTSDTIMEKVFSATDKSTPSKFPWWILLAILFIAILIYVLKEVRFSGGFGMDSKIKNVTPSNAKPTVLNNEGDEDGMDEGNEEMQDVKKLDDQVQNGKTRTWSDAITSSLRSTDEAEIYNKANLKEAVVGGKPALIRQDIDWSDYPIRNNPWLKDKLADYEKWAEYNNADLIGEGYPPRDKNGDPYELHHIGQHQDSPFAELTWAEHMGDGNNAILHPNRESEIDRQRFEQEKSQYWQARYKMFSQQELDEIYNK